MTGPVAQAQGTSDEGTHMDPPNFRLYEWINREEHNRRPPTVVIDMSPDLAPAAWAMVCAIADVVAEFKGVERKTACSVSTTAGWSDCTLDVVQIYMHCGDTYPL